MDLEDLNKTQIVLLVILVSFVTSIATGIVTVSLLAEAPPAVTQTVNHVIERTVETIVPKNNPVPTQTTKETTIVVKEDDLITSSIASALGKTARVFQDTSTSSPVVGLASEIAPGVFVTDSSIVSKEHLLAIGNIQAVFTVSKIFPDIGIAILKPEGTTTLPTPFNVGEVSSLALGQTVTAIFSVANDRVAIGSLSARSSFVPVSSESGSPLSVHLLDTNIDEMPIPGTPLVNISGDLVGIATVPVQTGKNANFVAASDIVALITASAGTSTPPAAH